MKDLNELYEFLEGKSHDEITKLIETNMKKVVKVYRNNSDGVIKGQIRNLDNLKNLTEWFFHKKLDGLMDIEQEKHTDDKLLWVKDVARMLNVNEATIRNYINRHILFPIEMGSTGKRKIYRFTQKEIDRFKEENQR